MSGRLRMGTQDRIGAVGALIAVQVCQWRDVFRLDAGETRAAFTGLERVLAPVADAQPSGMVPLPVSAELRDAACRTRLAEPRSLAGDADGETTGPAPVNPPELTDWVNGLMRQVRGMWVLDPQVDWQITVGVTGLLTGFGVGAGRQAMWVPGPVDRPLPRSDR